MSGFRIAVQLYSVREAAQKDFAATLKQIGAFGYEAVEFAGLHGHPPTQVRKMIDDAGLKAAAAHGPLPTKENLSEIVDAAKALGYAWHVTGFGPDKFSDEAATRKSIDQIAQAVALLKPAGLKMGLHNHWWEFDRKFGGKTPHQMIMESVPDVFAEIDTYWTCVGGGDAAATIKTDGARAPLLHIKDGPIIREAPHTAVGEGKMDWKAILAAARQTGAVEWLIVELDHCATDMMEAVRKSCVNLKAMLR